MSSGTTYRLRWSTRMPADQCLATLEPCRMLPLSSPSDFDDGMFDAGNVAPGVSIRALVPVDGLPEDEFWSIENGTLVFEGSLLNRFFRVDDQDTAGEPSRETVLLDALGRTCAAPDGHIVGAWNHEYLEHWMPMVWLGGRLMRGFVNGWSPDRLGTRHRLHSGGLKVGLMEIDPLNRSVVIPYDAF